VSRYLPLLILLLAPLIHAQPLPLPPQQTVAAIKLPAGFSVKLFAGEPDLVQPISFCIDDRGRVWVVESGSYPKWDTSGKDRISVFEDTNHDGQFDKKTVFLDSLAGITGIETGFGGVYVVGYPALRFIPADFVTLKPTGPAVTLLDGFGKQGTHNLVSGLVWGPDGWLYGGHGGTSFGWIGDPNAPLPDAPPSPNQTGTFHRHPSVMTAQNDKGPRANDQGLTRLYFDGGVWRYHPTRKIFEPVSEGTTNPWGLDFNDLGQAFISNSVTPHLYHVIPGSHVERRRISPNSRYAYAVIESIADHKHFAGGDWAKSRNISSDLGGGHAHCGMMLYQGDLWPEAYRNSFLFNNLHGDRMNHDLPERKGSGYVAQHGQDFLTCSDPWYMALHIKQTPDGNALLSDWYDTGECHTLKPNTTNGRLYKLSYTPRAQVQTTPGQNERTATESPARIAPIANSIPDPTKDFDLTALSSESLVQLQLSTNDWWVRRARRILQERGSNAQTHRLLQEILSDNPDLTRRLRALWALQVTGGATQELLLSLLADKDEYVRAWAVTFLAEPRALPAAVLARLEQLAESDPSPWLRLHIASALTRLPLNDRWPILAKLTAHAEDAGDPNLPFVCWYALEPLVSTNPQRALTLAANSRFPRLREFAARRIADTAR